MPVAKKSTRKGTKKRSGATKTKRITHCITQADEISFKVGTLIDTNEECIILQLTDKTEKRSMELALPSKDFLDMVQKVYSREKKDPDLLQIYS
jgi:hypothetical protein